MVNILRQSRAYPVGSLGVLERPLSYTFMEWCSNKDLRLEGWVKRAGLVFCSHQGLECLNVKVFITTPPQCFHCPLIEPGIGCIDDTFICALFKDPVFIDMRDVCPLPGYNGHRSAAPKPLHTHGCHFLGEWVPLSGCRLLEEKPLPRAAYLLIELPQVCFWIPAISQGIGIGTLHLIVPLVRRT